ncbi:MAG TPA: hypothetical protein VMR49_03475 [Candidatus Paceibacterota bacterium]|nr:hypothetical protein [Candidatus Paceibacterota bacterium]
MKEFNHSNYRDNLAKDLKEIRKTNPEKAQEYLSKEQEKNEYKEGKELIEQRRFYEEYKYLIPEIQQEIHSYSLENPGGDDIERGLEILRKNLREKENGTDFVTIFRVQQILRKNSSGDMLKKSTFSSKEQLLISELIPEIKKEELFNELSFFLKNKDYIKSYRIIEVLAYLGISGDLLEKIKKLVVNNGDVCFLNKLSSEFGLEFNESEILTLADNAYNQNSGYDLNEIIKKLPNIDNKFIEKRNILTEQAKEKYEINKKKIFEGVKSKDFFIHFSPTSKLDSIIKYGILSIIEQRKNKIEYKMGEGPDIQMLTGSLDTVSILNLYKGSITMEEKRDENAYDTKLMSELVSEIKNLMQNFKKLKREMVFEIYNINTNSSTKPFQITNEEYEESYEKKFTKLVDSNVWSDNYIDPKNIFSSSLKILRKEKKGNEKGQIWIDNAWQYEEIFPCDFFDDIEKDQDKMDLLNQIKKLRREKYEKSLTKKDLIVKKNVLESVFNLDKKDARIEFILDPNLPVTFAASLYQTESLIEDKITPDKILGAKVIDEYVKKYCYNNGMVGFNVFEMNDNNKIDKNDKNIILIEQNRMIKTIPIYD